MQNKSKLFWLVGLSFFFVKNLIKMLSNVITTVVCLNQRHLLKTGESLLIWFAAMSEEMHVFL